jgi:hypothetical protein
LLLQWDREGFVNCTRVAALPPLPWQHSKGETKRNTANIGFQILCNMGIFQIRYY